MTTNLKMSISKIFNEGLKINKDNYKKIKICKKN